MVAITFAVWYIITRPEGAAALVNSTLGGLGGAAESMSRFVNALP